MTTDSKERAGKTAGAKDSKGHGKLTGKATGKAEATAEPKRVKAVAGSTRTRPERPAGAPPRTVRGTAKTTRHFVLDREQYQTCRDRARQDGMPVSEVLVHILREYGAGLAAARRRPAASGTVPVPVRQLLATLDQERRNAELSGYLAALNTAGWQLATLALAMPEHQVQERTVTVVDEAGRESIETLPAKFDHPTRQAIHIRVRQAKAKGYLPPAGAPVPVAPDGPALPRAVKGSGVSKSNVMVRVEDDLYKQAAARALHEGVTMATVLRRGLDAWLASARDGDSERQNQLQKV